MRRRADGRLPIVAATAILAGCSVGPDFLRPKAPAVEGYTPEPLKTEIAGADVHGGERQRLAVGADIPGQWWELYHSRALTSLVEQALKANPTLAAAEATLRQARETAVAGEGALYPGVTASASATREKVNGAALGLPSLSAIFSYSTASVSVSYALDIFGGLRRQLEALRAQAEFERYQLEAAYLTLTTNLVNAAVQEASLRAQIRATQDIIDIETQELHVLRQQFELGGVAGAAVLQQQAALAQTQASLPGLTKQLAQQRNLLANLSGRLPSDAPAEQFDLASLQLPADLPVSLPSALVEHRPDVRSAEALLHAASAQIGVAIANQLPQVTLTSSAGSTAAPFTTLLGPGTSVWSFGASAAATIFDAGTLEHKKRAAVAAFDQAAAQYRVTVLQSFEDVANALRALQSDAETLQAQLAAEHAAADSLTVARGQFQAGGITYLSLLTAEQAFQQSHIALAQAQAARFADTAALFQALGGGWWNRNDVAQADGKSKGP
jgi:NodT family efflux transporter outer membrane factor (OMF) lipoprotein